MCAVKTKDASEYYRAKEKKYRKEGYSGSHRKQIAKDLGVSPAQADRYAYYDRLIHPLQKMVDNGIIGHSSLQMAATHPISEQQEIHTILCNAQKEGIRLTRELVINITRTYRTGKRTWDEIRPSCFNTIKKKRMPLTPAHITQEKAKNIKKQEQYMDGEYFEYVWFPQLLERNGFILISDTSEKKKSHDSGGDIIAQKDGIRYCFQCKYRSDLNYKIGIEAFQEVWFAKPGNCQIAVVVTNAKICSSAKNDASNRHNILAWDGDMLREMDNKAAKK